MKNILLLIFSILAVASINTFGQLEVTDYGDIPANRISASGWENFKWDGSGSWTTIDVTTKGIEPNKSSDMAPAINNLIKNGSGKRILKFPAGRFNLKSALNISKNDIQIIGAGKETKFILAGGSNDGHILVSGSKTGNYTITTSINRGQNKVQINSTSGLSVGDFIWVFQKGGERDGDTESQIVKILSISEKTLTVDMKFGIPFNKSKAKVQKFNMRKNIKLSNFYMERTATTTGKSDNIVLRSCHNVEVSFVESKKARNSHLQAFWIRDVLIYGTNFYGNFGGGGGYQYGCKINFSTRVNIVNNRANDLRHHFATQFGTDHCVIAYNRATGYNSYADFGQHNSKGSHNNLFEGNFGRELLDDGNRKGWGTRHTVWFRNYAIRKLGSEHKDVEWQTLIGNETRQGDAVLKGTIKPNSYTAANQVNTSSEGGSGTMRWGSLNKDSKIPASLFMKDRPSYVKRWLLYGPAASNGSGGPKNNPPVASFKEPITSSIEEGYGLLYVLVEASDPDVGDQVARTVLKIDGQEIRIESGDPYEWGKAGSANQGETLGLLPGDHLFEVVVTDTKGASTTAKKTITVTEKGVMVFSPIHDAYVENGNGKNDQVLRLESGRRTSFLKFDLSAITGKNIISADLILTVADDNGGGELRVYNSSNNSWTENGINGSNAPTKGALLATKNGTYGQGSTQKFNVSNLSTSGNNITFVIESDGAGGDDVSFASKENTAYAKPVLRLKADNITGGINTFIQDLVVFPNPSNVGIFHVSKGTTWEVYSTQGNLINSGSGLIIDLSESPKGVYLLKTKERVQQLVIQ